MLPYLHARLSEAITASLATHKGLSVPRKKLLTQIRKNMSCSARDVQMEFQAMSSIGCIEHDKEQDLCWLPQEAAA